jgi:hypothetical protein
MTMRARGAVALRLTAGLATGTPGAQQGVGLTAVALVAVGSQLQPHCARIESATSAGIAAAIDADRRELPTVMACFETEPICQHMLKHAAPKVAADPAKCIRGAQRDFGADFSRQTLAPKLDQARLLPLQKFRAFGAKR